jgi:hypothetical protein
MTRTEIRATLSAVDGLSVAEDRATILSRLIERGAHFDTIGAGVAATITLHDIRAIGPDRATAAANWILAAQAALDALEELE